MRFSNSASKVLCVVGSIALGTRAAIVGIKPFTGTFTATSTSAITVVFNTAPTIIIREDYSVVLGVFKRSDALASSLIGHEWEVVDLEERGFKSTFGQDVILKGLGLFNTDFPAGNGSYVITATVTSGNGPGLTPDLQSYSTPLEVVVQP